MKSILTSVFAFAAVSLAFVCATPSAVAQGTQDSPYTVNGEPPPIATQQMMMLNGLPPGAYYLHTNGDFGLVGEPPMMNVNGGPPLGNGAPPAATGSQNAGGADPAAPGAPPAADSARPAGEGRRQGGPSSSQFPDLVREATRARIFWVYSPSIFSGATGGSSGYVHLCPDGLALRSSEGSISIGGDYNPDYVGGRDSWAGVAGVSASAGRWAIEPGAQGPDLVVYSQDGSSQRAPVSVVRQGSWKYGQTKYAIEPNKASCPS